jgi:hypothetical protein
MAEFSFDGKRLKNKSGQKMGELDRNLIRAWRVLEFDGKDVKDDRGTKLTTIDEIQKTVLAC